MFFFDEDGLTPIKEKRTKSTLIHRFQAGSDYSCYLNWKPFAPSGIKRKDIAVWQYGKDCHPIEDDKGTQTVFNINLVRDKKIIIEKMF